MANYDSWEDYEKQKKLEAQKRIDDSNAFLAELSALMKKYNVKIYPDAWRYFEDEHENCIVFDIDGRKAFFDLDCELDADGVLDPDYPDEIPC